MSDHQSVMEAALKDFENEGKQKPKTVAKKPEPNQMWQNLQYMESQSQKFEKEAQKFIPKPKSNKPVITESEIEEKIDPNFDDNSLALYGALLSDSLDAAKPGHERAIPKLKVEKVLTKQQKERQRKIKDRANVFLEDANISDEQEKEILID